MSADEMFDELGYEKFETIYGIQYAHRDNAITFKKGIKKIKVFSTDYDDEINMQELKAINKKVQELGWEE